MATRPDPERARRHLEDAEGRARADEALRAEAASLLGQMAERRSSDSWRDSVRALFRGE